MIVAIDTDIADSSTRNDAQSKSSVENSTNLQDSDIAVVSLSLAVGSGFGQKFKPDPRVDVRPGWTDQSSQLDPRIGVRRVLPSLSETSYI
jgi:hypothetical protein